MWADMWQLPTAEGLSGSITPPRLRMWLRERYGLACDPPTPVGSFTHLTTHRTIRFVIWSASTRTVMRDRTDRQWRRPDDVDDLPLSNPQRRALRLVFSDSDRSLTGALFKSEGTCARPFGPEDRRRKEIEMRAFRGLTAPATSK
jgi:hypothetical protein